MSRRLALLAAVPLATLTVAATASAAPATPPHEVAPAQGITFCHEGFETLLAPHGENRVVVLIGANDYGLVARPAC